MLEIGSSDYLTSRHFNARERAAVLWAEHVAQNTARERDDVFDEVRRAFNDQELVELTAVCGLFAQSNRFQDSMRLPIEEPAEVDKIRASVRADPQRLKVYLERIVAHWPQSFPGSTDTTPQVRETAAPQAAATGTAHRARVPLLNAPTAPADSARFMAAARQLLGGVSNAIRVWAHVPHIAKLFLPLFVAFERDGAGSSLPARVRLAVMLKTHHTHSAPYLLAHHTALARAVGFIEDDLAALGAADHASAQQFSPAERAAIAWAGQVACNEAKRNDAVFDELQRHFNAPGVVELTSLCAVCSNADLIHNALRVPLEAAADIEALNSSPRIDPERIKTYIETVLADWPAAFPIPDAAAAA